MLQHIHVPRTVLGLVDLPLELFQCILLFPSFIAAYLEHRVKKETNQGNTRLMCIRQITERLAARERTALRITRLFSELAAPKVTDIFSRHQGPVGPLCPDFLDALSQIAAVYLSHNTISDPRMLSASEYHSFSSYEKGSYLDP
ncbi:hypothetical protein HBH98_129860 [Parastagonospora nodorum]|nr:hypothetical protein HBH54_175740 [Parastagonospora nodorum]KAH3953248.1 hypothetical protein HBH53_037120 [Parastagonospora nodorum]KAH3984438.1 hypothetical protein HBH51_027260 [Parastagonospora nodorum]KAH4051832.1 hypothetical protein HBH49_108540 [Parastagonospora nodorum]KAH4085460.1 hypothetical protein HBH48_149670 [Parastagonospora nodorum]